MKDAKNDILARASFLYGGIFLFGIAILVKATLIYAGEGKELREKAKKQEIRSFVLESQRGNILSDNMDLLATSVPIFDVRMDVANPNVSDELFYSKVDSLAWCLHNLFPDRSKYYYKNLLTKARKRHNRYRLIRRKVTYSELQQIRTFPILRRGKTRGGLITVQRNHRERPFGELAARTIGFVNEKEGLYVGLEGYYNDVLKGINGEQLRRRINHGDWIPISDEHEKQPVNGKDIKTTLDINIQDVAEHALLKKMIYHRAKIGTAVVMEVQTGHILAMVNLNYDSTDGKYKENFNFAIGKRIEPGSTFKLASIMAALEHHKTKLTDSLFFEHNYTVYSRRTLRDAHVYNHGRFTVREAFEHSSNMGISRVVYNAYKNNPAQYVDFLYSVGLNKKTGIELKGEAAPYIKHPIKNKKIWWKTTLPWMSIGYEVMLTPLQILTFYNAVANNGKMVKPMLVTEIQQDGKTLKKFDPKVLNPQIASPKTITTAQSLLEGVVLRGTGKKLRNRDYAIAGKTGTAQISEGQGYHGSARRRYNATFVGYFPADNPKYSIIVVVNQPTENGYYGGTVAGPVFKEISDYIYANSISLENKFVADTVKPKILKIKSPVWFGDIENLNEHFGFKSAVYADKSNWVVPEPQGNTITYSPVNIRPSIMPNVRGMTAKDAVFLLESMGLNTALQGRGKVVRQSVRPGTVVKKGNQVTLNLGNW
jgi:cell division protein FtsI (penicillin-binding protein 3)